jgi:hypothetical protein
MSLQLLSFAKLKSKSQIKAVAASSLFIATYVHGDNTLQL